MSTVDLISDIYVIWLYVNEEGQQAYGWSMLAMVCVSMFFQLGLVFMQNRNAGFMQLCRECLIVLVGLKPGITAMRLLQAKNRWEFSLFDSKTELIAIKVIEMFGESIPGERRERKKLPTPTSPAPPLPSLAQGGVWGVPPRQIPRLHSSAAEGHTFFALASIAPARRLKHARALARHCRAAAVLLLLTLHTQAQFCRFTPC
jgi:hypothetical protein